MMQLSEKEASLLKELKGQENLCIEKYEKAACAAVDGQLKGLFSNLADLERKHLDTLTGMENGAVPAAPAGGEQAMPAFTSVYGPAESDTLSGEKHVSALYDTCIFEFKNNACRAALNHIQKEEQTHGKMIYDYMAANGMYGS